MHSVKDYNKSFRSSAAEKEWLRPLLPEEEEKANLLFESVFGKKRSIETWRWKFRDSPLAAYGSFLTAEQDGRLVAIFPVLPLRLKVGSGEVTAAQPVEVCVAPEWHGPAAIIILKELLAFANRESKRLGRAFAFGFPNEPHYLIGKELLGYRDIGRISVMRRHLTLAHLAARCTRKRSLVSAARRFSRLLLNRSIVRKKFRGGMEDLRIERVPRFDERFDRLWEKAKDIAPILIKRDSSYLQWRFSRCPEARYITLGCFRGNSLEGYSVLRLKQNLLNEGFIADIFAPGEDAARFLLGASVDFLAAAGADSVTAWCVKHHFLFRQLRALGFKEMESSVPLVFMPIAETCRQDLISDFQNWYITLGDSDGV